MNLKQKAPPMGELLDKLHAAEASDKEQVKDAHPPLADGVERRLFSLDSEPLHRFRARHIQSSSLIVREPP